MNTPRKCDRLRGAPCHDDVPRRGKDADAGPHQAAGPRRSRVATPVPMAREKCRPVFLPVEPSLMTVPVVEDLGP
jgi:hypothetical protein